MSTQQVLAVAPRASVKGPLQPSGHSHLRGSDFKWAIAFLAPYATVFLGFVVYPFGYALWMASKPSLYADLMADQSYVPSVVNTLVFVGVVVNVKIFLALLLSGFFMRRRWWIRALLAAYVLPWAIATAQACISFHWMLQGDQGLVDGVLWEVSGINGPIWFNNRWLGVGSNIIAYVWKWMPFWTIIFLAARMKISRDLYDAAKIDGAIGSRCFAHVTSHCWRTFISSAPCSLPSGRSAISRPSTSSRVGGQQVTPMSSRHSASVTLSTPAGQNSASGR